MQYSPELDGPDLLDWWIRQPNQRGRHRARRPTTSDPPGTRFAFYGRMSTVGFQDRASSCRWQRDYAVGLVACHGRIVVEFFDEDVSRRVAWPDRPQASRLLTAMADPARGFDAIVVGEYERAFHGQQLEQLTPTLLRNGVQLWLPETYGPVDFDNPRQLALLDLLGVHSRREVSRARYRTTAAMRAQAELQGRHLGGRPPYGYRLVDAGPHPNRAHAAWGRRLHRLDPDPATAPHVRWIFEQRLAGYSVASIARALNDRGVPCPSDADPARNRHRSGQRWMLTTVAAILANPRYTGRQVWNRQRTDHDGIEPDCTIARHHQIQRWNAAPQWVISRQTAHPPLVTEEQFVAAQAIHTAPTPTDGTPRTTSWPASCAAASAAASWTPTGSTAVPATAAGTATPAPAPRPLPDRRPSTSGKTTSWTASGTTAACTATTRVAQPRPGRGRCLPAHQNMIIGCGHHTRTIEAETAIYTLHPPGSCLTTTAKIPLQRDGDHAKHEKASRVVWK
ncbi:recombinase family protein [Micromonospora sicca]|uniref:Recombinase family protein n=1 Tax=Micromonospora sicca TaxID=2202420 RepID=A0A317DRD8_9ACTN|nr:recombinase family protein [Micromonospora sp. 4G51]